MTTKLLIGMCYLSHTRIVPTEPNFKTRPAEVKAKYNYVFKHKLLILLLFSAISYAQPKPPGMSAREKDSLDAIYKITKNMRIIDLPQDIRERAEANIKNPECEGGTWTDELSDRDQVLDSFQWHLTKEDVEYWDLVNQSKFDEARELLNQPKGEKQ